LAALAHFEPDEEHTTSAAHGGFHLAPGGTKNDLAPNSALPDWHLAVAQVYNIISGLIF
jgi:hypothetical protein